MSLDDYGALKMWEFLLSKNLVIDEWSFRLGLKSQSLKTQNFAQDKNRKIVQFCLTYLRKVASHKTGSCYPPALLLHYIDPFLP